MALTADRIESAEPEPWTGKAEAVVYETVEEAAAWLSERGYEAFAGQAAAAQEASLLRATEGAEDAVRFKFRGRPVQPDQGLLLPARGAYDSRGHLLAGSGQAVGAERAVRGYLEGIRLLAEAVAGGFYMQQAVPGAALVRSEATRRGRVEYRDGVDPTSIATNHPEAWRRIIQIAPRLI